MVLSEQKDVLSFCHVWVRLKAFQECMVLNHIKRTIKSGEKDETLKKNGENREKTEKITGRFIDRLCLGDYPCYT